AFLSSTSYLVNTDHNVITCQQYWLLLEYPTRRSSDLSTNHHWRSNLSMMAVLNGSTSAAFSASIIDSREMPNSTSRMMYLIAHSRSCTAKGSSYWVILNLRAISLISSCSAPKGHSQPQNTPRPHSRMLAAVKVQRMKITGSLRNSSQRNSVTSACTKVRTLTIDSCPSAYQPMNTTVKVR